jgi:opine dehydrogenase
MNKLPEQILVLGAGGGGLTIAAELGLAGHPVTIGDLPAFAGGLGAIHEAGGIQITFRGPEATTQFAPVAGTTKDPQQSVKGVPLVIVCVPSFGHMPFAETLAPVVEDGQTILWVGEGGGSFSLIAALRAIGRHPELVLADTNSLPYAGAAVVAPGEATAKRKTGGTYIAGVPTSQTDLVYQLTSQIWRWIKPARNAWETLFLNFNAIDHVPTMLGNLGQIENRRDKMKLWGEGASPGVGRLIGAVDGEYGALREGLGLPVEKWYLDFLVEQGLVDYKRDTVAETIQASLLKNTEFQCGPDALKHRFVAEDVPYSLVLASSIGDEIDVRTPVIDSLITFGSTASGRDYWNEGRTLATWGLKGAGRSGLLSAVERGWW